MTAWQQLLLTMITERGSLPAFMGKESDWQALADYVKPDVIHHQRQVGMLAFDEQVYVLATEGERVI